MRRNNEKKIILIVCTLIITLCFLMYGCAQKIENSNLINHNEQNSSNDAKVSQANENSAASEGNHSGAPYYQQGYSPLTYGKFSAIRNNLDEFSAIYIYYLNDTDYDERGMPQDSKSLRLRAGIAGINRLYSSIDNYIGVFKHYIFLEYSIDRTGLKQDFSNLDVEQILDYLVEDQEKQDYFFSNYEFTGLDDPHDSPSVHLHDKYFSFTLVFFKPDSDYYAWAISKCVDDYPEQGTPLYGLFDIIETNFISQFE